MHDMAYSSRDASFKVIRSGAGELSGLVFETPAEHKHVLKAVKFDEVQQKVFAKARAREQSI
jgi:hypothetical protein